MKTTKLLWTNNKNENKQNQKKSYGSGKYQWKEEEGDRERKLMYEIKEVGRKKRMEGTRCGTWLWRALDRVIVKALRYALNLDRKKELSKEES